MISHLLHLQPHHLYMWRSGNAGLNCLLFPTGTMLFYSPVTLPSLLLLLERSLLSGKSIWDSSWCNLGVIFPRKPSVTSQPKPRVLPHYSVWFYIVQVFNKYLMNETEYLLPNYTNITGIFLRVFLSSLETGSDVSDETALFTALSSVTGMRQPCDLSLLTLTEWSIPNGTKQGHICSRVVYRNNHRIPFVHPR